MSGTGIAVAVAGVAGLGLTAAVAGVVGLGLAGAGVGVYLAFDAALPMIVSPSTFFR